MGVGKEPEVEALLRRAGFAKKTRQNGGGTGTGRGGAKREGAAAQGCARSAGVLQGPIQGGGQGGGEGDQLPRGGRQAPQDGHRVAEREVGGADSGRARPVRGPGRGGPPARWG